MTLMAWGVNMFSFLIIWGVSINIIEVYISLILKESEILNFNINEMEVDNLKSMTISRVKLSELYNLITGLVPYGRKSMPCRAYSSLFPCERM